jgi:hypothetical protein
MKRMIRVTFLTIVMTTGLLLTVTVVEPTLLR